MTARALLALIVLTLACAAHAGPTPETPAGMLAFAQSLNSSGDSYRAVTEYLRVLHYYDGDAETRQRAFEGLAAAYAKAGRWQDAAETLTKLHAEKPDARTRHLLGDALFRAGRTLEAANLLLGGDYGESEKKLGTVAWLKSGAPGEAPNAADLCMVERYRALPKKSPATAGVLSALLPGSGHLYVDRPRDAAMAFALNALFIWGAIEAADRHQWGLTGLLGAAEVFWYSGTIVGAVNGAHKWNRREEERFFDAALAEAKPRWSAAPLPVEKGGGLAFTVNW